MRLRFLGTGGYHPNERRHTASLLFPELGVVFDAGTSLFRLAAQLVQPEIDIFLTHAHLDHVQGLTYLLVPLALKKITRCRIHAEEPKIAAIREHLFADLIFPVMPQVEWIPLQSEVVIGHGRAVVTHCSLHHPGGSVGLKLEAEGKRVAYITDTTASDSYLPFIHGMDLLIHECYFPDELAEWAEKTGHSCTSQVASLAKQANVGQLYLTHIDPQRPDDDPIGLQTARAIFPKTQLAEDQMEVEF